MKAIEVAEKVFSVTVDYAQSLANMVRAGNYDWVNSDITEKHFPVKGEGKTEKELHLVHLNRAISSDDAVRELDKMGYAPAKIEDLLALGASYPELQRQFPIVALGSVWRRLLGHRHVPCLWSYTAERYLRLHWLEGDWREDHRFLAVRK